MNHLKMPLKSGLRFGMLKICKDSLTVGFIKIDVRMSAIKPLSVSWSMSSIAKIYSTYQLAINGFRHAEITHALQMLRSSDTL